MPTFETTGLVKGKLWTTKMSVYSDPERRYCDGSYILEVKNWESAGRPEPPTDPKLGFSCFETYDEALAALLITAGVGIHTSAVWTPCMGKIRFDDVRGTDPKV